MSRSGGLCRPACVSTRGYDSPTGRHGLANRLLTTGCPTPNLSTLRWGCYGGWRSAGNREALPLPRCDPFQNLATSATPDYTPGTDCSGQVPRDDLTSTVTPCPRSGQRNGGSPHRPAWPRMEGTLPVVVQEISPVGAHQHVPAYRGRRSVVTADPGYQPGAPDVLLSGDSLARVMLAGDRSRSSLLANVARIPIRCVRARRLGGSGRHGRCRHRPTTRSSRSVCQTGPLARLVGLLAQRPSGGGQTPVARVTRPGGRVGPSGRPACAGSPVARPRPTGPALLPRVG